MHNGSSIYFDAQRQRRIDGRIREAGNGKHLVVDDDKVISLIMKLLLECEGHRTPSRATDPRHCKYSAKRNST